MQDAAPGNGFGDAWEARVARTALDAERTGLTHFRLRPGKRSPFTHRHREAEEIYVILGGSGRARLGDDVVEVGPLDAIRTAPETARAFEAGDEGLELIALGPHRPGDGEPADDAWPAAASPSGVGYTRVNLREVEDIAPRFGFDAIQEARFAWRPLQAQETGVAYHRIKPGRRGGAHRHDEAEEVFVVLAGSGRAYLDGEIVPLRAGDAIRLAPPVVRAFASGPDGLDLLVFGRHHERDGEILAVDVWADAT